MRFIDIVSHLTELEGGEGGGDGGGSATRQRK